MVSGLAGINMILGWPAFHQTLQVLKLLMNWY